MGVDLGMDEIGFVALHIYSAMTNQNISQVREHSQLITDLVNLVSDQLWRAEYGSRRRLGNT